MLSVWAPCAIGTESARIWQEVPNMGTIVNKKRSGLA